MLLFHSQNVPVENKNLVKNGLRWKAIVGEGVIGQPETSYLITLLKPG